MKRWAGNSILALLQSFSGLAVGEAEDMVVEKRAVSVRLITHERK